jgi:RNA polymerase sigma-70 factor (ECF subfamily)
MTGRRFRARATGRAVTIRGSTPLPLFLDPDRAPMADTSLSLLERLRDQAAPTDWDRLMQLYAPLLRQWLTRQPLQAADAEDVLQDVLAIVVRRLPEFRHNGGPGAFRGWLRGILANRLRYYWRQRQHRPVPAGGGGAEEFLAQLEEPHSELSRQWDAEHDRHVVGRLLEMIRPDFSASTWQAFRRYALDGDTPAQVAAELRLSVNAVCVARSRVLRRLRQEARGLLDG